MACLMRLFFLISTYAVILANTANSFAQTGEFGAVPACGGFFGRVFHDVNRDGFCDVGEQGLPGVRVVSSTGAQITTDKYGLFQVGCAEGPVIENASHFVLKLDPQSLPVGFYLPSERPLAVLLTQGKSIKAEFGAVLAHVVRVEFYGDAFVANATGLKTEWLASIDKLVEVLTTQPSLLRLTYFVAEEELALTQARAALLKYIINHRLGKSTGNKKLPIEVRIVYQK
jgi:large repetitive protein